MNPKVSIIVPIFNMEKYLERCLNSLKSQTLADIEIIAVNDGSSDHSLKILENYAKDDPRIIIINKENGGVSSARNKGILAARGQFIGFVDPDDWVDFRMYEELYNTAVKDTADIVMCTYIREFGTHSNEKKFNFPAKVTYKSEDVRTNILRRLVGPLGEELANPEYLDAWGTVWSKLYRSKLIKENQLQFIDLHVVGSNEDSLFNINASYFANSFVFINTPFYHYWRANLDSITSKHNPLLAEKFNKLYVTIEAFIQEKNLSKQYYLALNNRICINVLGLGLNIISDDNHVSMRMKIRSLHTLLNNDRVKTSMRQFPLKNCPLVWKAFFLSAKLRFSILIYFMLKAINWIRKKNTGGVQLESGPDITSSDSDESRWLRNDVDELLPSNGSKKNTI